MQTKQIVQSSANVVRITSISAGDVYKRFDDNSDDRVYYGVVRNVHNDGTKTIIEAVEYSYRWSSVTVDYKVLRGEKDYILFPCTPDDLNLELTKARNDQEKAIEEAQKKIATAQALIKEIDGLVSGQTMQNLKASSYKELTQAEYDRKVAEISAA